jgi:hypothetical protein
MLLTASEDFRLYANGLAINCQELIKGVRFLLQSLLALLAHVLTRTQRKDISKPNEGSAMLVSCYVAGIEYEKSDRVSVMIAILERPT